MAAIAVPIAACERDAEQDRLTAGSNMLTDEQVDRALGPETLEETQALNQDSPGTPAAPGTQAQTRPRTQPQPQAQPQVAPDNGEAGRATPPQAEEEEE